MKILIIDLDSKIPNLALKKIEAYHTLRGDEIIWDLPLASHWADKIYVSCIFTKNRAEAEEWTLSGADVGGSGYDLHKNLPPEIESIKLRINWGFTTRGCIRRCPFCIVYEKEGLIHAVDDLYGIWDGKSREVVIMDNNILSLPDHFELVAGQLIKEKVRVDFNQGLDHRLLNEHNVALLKKIRRKQYRFAFDNAEDYPSVEKAVTLLTDNGINHSVWYVLVGFNTTFQQDMERLIYLKKRDQRVYVMRHENVHGIRKYNEMASWGNQRNFFMTHNFEEFIKIHNKKPSINEE